MEISEKVVNWIINGTDSPLPLSCRHVLSVITGEKEFISGLYTSHSHPTSAEEVFMCLSIIDHAGAYQHTMQLAELSLEWRQLIENWNEIFSAYMAQDLTECSVILKRIRKSWKCEKNSPVLRSMSA